MEFMFTATRPTVAQLPAIELTNNVPAKSITAKLA
jgi:hypothetical protein